MNRKGSVEIANPDRRSSSSTRGRKSPVNKKDILSVEDGEEGDQCIRSKSASPTRKEKNKDKEKDKEKDTFNPNLSTVACTIGAWILCLFIYLHYSHVAILFGELNIFDLFRGITSDHGVQPSRIHLFIIIVILGAFGILFLLYLKTLSVKKAEEFYISLGNTRKKNTEVIK